MERMDFYGHSVDKEEIGWVEVKRQPMDLLAGVMALFLSLVIPIIYLFGIIFMGYGDNYGFLGRLTPFALTALFSTSFLFLRNNQFQVVLHLKSTSVEIASPLIAKEQTSEVLDNFSFLHPPNTKSL